MVNRIIIFILGASIVFLGFAWLMGMCSSIAHILVVTFGIFFTAGILYAAIAGLTIFRSYTTH